MNYLAATGLINFLACAGLGVFVLAKNRRSIVNISYFALNASVALYSIGYFVWQLSTDMVVAQIWFKVLFAGIVLINISYLFFVFNFLGILKERKYPMLFFSGASLFFIVANIRGDLYKDFIIRGDFGHWPVPTNLFNLYLGFWFLQCLYGFYYLLSNIKTSSSRRSLQIGYFTIAAVVGFFGGANNWPLWYGVPFPPYANILISVYIAIVTYAIVRHQLLDIEVIVKKTLVFAGLFVASYGIFSTFAYLGSSLFENITQNRWVALIPSVFIIVLILRPLESFLKSATDKYLFQKNYDYKSLLRTFTDEVITVIDLNKLVNLTVNKLSEIIKLESASIFLDRDENGDFALVAATEEDLSIKSLAESSELIEVLSEGRSYILASELESGGNPSEYIKNDLKAVNSDLVIPLMQPGRLIGALALGKKKSDEDFTQDDIDILLPLARTFTVAISNAMLFVKLSEAQAQAAQREKMAVIGTLSAGINHEICNPLGIARGQCEMFLLNLKEGLYADKSQEELLDKAQEIMDKVIKETDRATVITRKLSSFAKPARGLLADDVNAENEIDEVITLIEHDLKLDNIVISKEISEGVPGITADRKQIQEVLFNIIRNAAQAIKEKGNIYIRVRNTGDRVFIDIEDTGDGISQKNLEQIFDPFFTTKEPGKGTGLGLFIVKQIVEKNRGMISARSTPGVGTVFTLEFQASKGNADTEDIQ